MCLDPAETDPQGKQLAYLVQISNPERLNVLKDFKKSLTQKDKKCLSFSGICPVNEEGTENPCRQLYHLL